MRRPALAVALLAAMGVAIGAPGCSKRKSVTAPNLPPETSVFVRGPVDTANYRIHLYWFGSDVDGEVVAYDMRFVPTAGDPNPKWETLRCARPGRCTDSVFTVPTGDSTLIHTRFEIRAVDDQGAVDPTPAIQSFQLSNLPPQVTIKSPYGSGDSTYASLTTSWEALDPDGSGRMHYRIWLDGNAASYDSTAERTFTLPSSRFIQNGTYASGPRTLFIQAVDEGGLRSPVASMTWYVRAPAAALTPDLRGELLLIDDVPSAGQANATFDAFYLAAVTDSLSAQRFSVLRPQFNPRIFRSTRDFAQTLRQFKAVMWYRGQETNISPLLQTYQDSLEAYLDAGGNLYLDGLYLIRGPNTPGALTQDFAPRRLRTTGMFLNLRNVADSTAGWSNSGTTSLFRSSIYGDVMRATFTVPTIQRSDLPVGELTPGIRAFVVSDTGSVALWAMDSQLSPPNAGWEAPVGISTAQFGGGRLIVITTPLRLGTPAPAGRMLRRMLFGYSNGAVFTPGLIRP
jgi:hypothetical protein